MDTVSNDSPKAKRFTLICRRPPYGSANAKELVDIALATAVFDQALSLLLMGDGVYQLLQGQDPSGIEQKNHEKLMQMLEIYGVERTIVQSSALKERGLKLEQLCEGVTAMENDEIAAHLETQDICINL